MDLYKNPEKEPRPELNEPPQFDVHDWPFEIAGPGGRTTNIENNERGILDAVLFRTMASYRQADLSSTHDSHAQGIYRDTDDRYAD